METTPEIGPENYRFLQDYIYRGSGIVLDEDKHYLLSSRLTPILEESRLASLDHLCTVLRADGAGGLGQSVIEALATNETTFFRDPAQFDALKRTVIPELAAQRRTLRFWSAASSSGQEAYSVAMLLLESNLGRPDAEILATDLSRRILEKARLASYSQIEISRGLPPEYLTRHFTAQGGGWRLNEEVRRMVRFECFDLRHGMEGLGQFDVILCRNVLIYFDVPTKKKILAELGGRLAKGGYLMLGGSETTLNLDDRFERVVMDQAVMYRVA